MMIDQGTGGEVAEGQGIEAVEADREAGLLADHLDGARADREVDRPAEPAERLDQADRVRSPAGPGHPHDQGRRGGAGGHRATWAVLVHREGSPTPQGLVSIPGLVPTYRVAIPRVNGYIFRPVSPREASRSSISCPS